MKGSICGKAIALILSAQKRGKILSLMKVARRVSSYSVHIDGVQKNNLHVRIHYFQELETLHATWFAERSYRDGMSNPYREL